MAWGWEARGSLGQCRHCGIARGVEGSPIGVGRFCLFSRIPASRCIRTYRDSRPDSLAQSGRMLDEYERRDSASKLVYAPKSMLGFVIVRVPSKTDGHERP